MENNKTPKPQKESKVFIVKKMRDEGKTVLQIALELKISPQAVYYYINRYRLA